MNVLIDNNIVLDIYNDERKVRFRESVEIVEYIKNNVDYNVYISFSSLDNLKFVKAMELKSAFGFASKIILKKFIEDILANFRNKA